MMNLSCPNGNEDFMPTPGADSQSQEATEQSHAAELGWFGY